MTQASLLSSKPWINNTTGRFCYGSFAMTRCKVLIYPSLDITSCHSKENPYVSTISSMVLKASGGGRGCQLNWGGDDGEVPDAPPALQNGIWSELWFHSSNIWNLQQR